MGDGRRCRNVAVYARYGEFLVMVWVESGEVCRIREIWGEEKERKRRFPFLYRKICGCGRECDSISINFG